MKMLIILDYFMKYKYLFPFFILFQYLNLVSSEQQIEQDKPCQVIPYWVNREKIKLMEPPQLAVLSKLKNIKEIQEFPGKLPDIIASYTPTVKLQEEATKDMMDTLLNYNLNEKQKIPDIKFAIENGANVNINSLNYENRHLYPLNFAIDMVHLEIVKILLEAGANADAEFSHPYNKCIFKDSPLLVAISKLGFIDSEELIKLKEIIELLLKKGANPNIIKSYFSSSSIETPLTRLTLRHEYSFIELLLKYKADPEIGRIYDGKKIKYIIKDDHIIGISLYSDSCIIL